MDKVNRKQYYRNQSYQDIIDKRGDRCPKNGIGICSKETNECKKKSQREYIIEIIGK
jgi:hypothetical protein